MELLVLEHSFLFLCFLQFVVIEVLAWLGSLFFYSFYQLWDIEESLPSLMVSFVHSRLSYSLIVDLIIIILDW